MKGGVPDAWDDDWVNVADKPETKVVPQDTPPKLTKAERRAQHIEQQKELWDAAENPGRKLWLEAQGVDVPLEQSFAQPVQLLSRKPPAAIAKRSTTEGIQNLSLQDDDEDSEEERRKKQQSDLEERQRKAQLEREEKLKRYAEARERIMGSPKSSPTAMSRENSNGRDGRRPRGSRNNIGNSNRRSQTASPAEQSPAPPQSSDRMLFEPDDMSRRLAPRREVATTPKPDEPIRQPRGPSNSGRGRFGFAPRGNSTAT